MEEDEEVEGRKGGERKMEREEEGREDDIA